MDNNENLNNSNEELLNSILADHTEPANEIDETRLPTRRPKKKANVKKIVLICLVVFLSLVLIGLVAGVMYVDYVFGRLTNNTNGFWNPDPSSSLDDPWNWDKTDPTDDTTFGPTGTTGPLIPGTTATGGIVIPTDPTTTPGSSTKPTTTLPNTSITIPMTSVPPIKAESKNIMLLGADKSGKRTDTMILCTINVDKKTVTLTSFMRDMLVTIPGKSSLYKLNAAYYLGGKDLLEETILYNFGVEIDDFVLIKMEKFPELIDMLGGVDVKFTKEEANYFNKNHNWNIEAGVNHLNGEQALKFARMRKLDGDHQRVQRQQRVLQAIFNAYKGKSVTQLFGIMEDVLNANVVSMTMTKDELWAYAGQVFRIVGDMDLVRKKVPDYYYRVDIDGDGKIDPMYTEGRYNGQAVLFPNFDVCRKYLEEILNP